MIEVDHPNAGQVIASTHYTIRLGGPDTLASVEVSIDQGSWHACRRACGYWWYDWADCPPGEHALVARGHNRDGSIESSHPRRFSVTKK